MKIEDIINTFDAYLSSLDIVEDRNEYLEVLEEKNSWMEYILKNNL